MRRAFRTLVVLASMAAGFAPSPAPGEDPPPAPPGRCFCGGPADCPLHRAPAPPTDAPADAPPAPAGEEEEQRRAELLRGEILILAGSRDAHARHLAEYDRVLAAIHGFLEEYIPLRDALHLEREAAGTERERWTAAAGALRARAAADARRAVAAHDSYLTVLEEMRKAGRLTGPAAHLAVPAAIAPNTPESDAARDAIGREDPPPPAWDPAPSPSDLAWERLRSAAGGLLPPGAVPGEPTGEGPDGDRLDELPAEPTAQEIPAMERIRERLQQEILRLRARREEAERQERAARALAHEAVRAIEVLRGEARRARIESHGAREEAAAAFAAVWVARVRAAVALHERDLLRRAANGHGEESPEDDDTLRERFRRAAPLFAALRTLGGASPPAPSRDGEERRFRGFLEDLGRRIDRHGDERDAAAIRSRLRVLARARHGLPQDPPAAALAWERDAAALLESPDGTDGTTGGNEE